MIKNQFPIADPETTDLLEEFLKRLLIKIKGHMETDLINKAIAELVNHPLLPKNDLAISFSYEDTTFYVIYCHYKIELSDYFRETWEGGGESIKRFNFQYNVNGYREKSGNADEFRWLLIDSLENALLENISISTEE